MLMQCSILLKDLVVSVIVLHHINWHAVQKDPSYMSNYLSYCASDS